MSSLRELGLRKKNAFWEIRPSALFISETVERISTTFCVDVGGDTLKLSS